MEEKDVQKWEDLCKDLKFLVNSVGYGLPANEIDRINKDYRTYSEGRDLNAAVSAFGFSSLIDLLFAIGASFVMRSELAKRFHMAWPPKRNSPYSSLIKPEDPDVLVVACLKDAVVQQPPCQPNSTPSTSGRNVTQPQGMSTRPRIQKRKATGMDEASSSTFPSYMPSGEEDNKEEEAAGYSSAETATVHSASSSWSFDAIVSPIVPFKKSAKACIEEMTEADLLKGFGTGAKEEKPKPPSEPPRVQRNENRPRRVASHVVPFVKEANSSGVVELLESEDPLLGRIHLLQAPFQRSFPKVSWGSYRVEGWLWDRIFNILRNYASEDVYGNREWLLLETFDSIYYRIFRQSFRPAEWNNPDLMAVFSSFHELVYLEVDAAGFVWTSLKETPTRIESGKLYRLQEDVKLARKRLREEEATTILIRLKVPLKVGEGDAYVIKNNIFGILLEYFPSGMDCLQLRWVYEAKYHRDDPRLPIGSPFQFCANELMDFCKFDEKSPVHGILYPRLDLDIAPPHYFSLDSLEETEKEVKRKLDWRQYEARVGRAQRT